MILAQIYRLAFECFMNNLLHPEFVIRPAAFGLRVRARLCGWIAVLFLGISSLPLPLSAVRVIEASAIPFTAFLPKGEFDQRFPGEHIEDLSSLEPGWYVRYKHESLNYYFGPTLLRSTGEDYLAELKKILEAAVAQRPSIQGYELTLSYEPSVGADSNAQRPSSPENAPSAPAAGAPASAPPSVLWGWIRRIFGF